MRVGMNIAWQNYGWDFGAPPQRDSGSLWGPRAAWLAGIDARLAELRALGVFAIRWFIVADGIVLGTHAQKPHPDPRGGPGWRFDEVPALSPEFVADFEALLVACERAGLLLVPVLLDFHFCFPGLALPGSDAYVKQGRADAILDPRKRVQLLERVLAPLLAVSQRHAGAIYAWELMNEPEWCTHEPYSPSDALSPNKTVPLAEMRAFFAEGARLLRQAGFRSTVGFAMHATVRRWDAIALDLTLHQFHYYATVDASGQPAPLPVQDFDPRWPLFVGEIATAPHRPWPELGGAQDLRSRLWHVARKGFPAVFLWSANREEERIENPAVDFGDAAKAQIRAFVTEQQGPGPRIA